MEFNNPIPMLSFWFIVILFSLKGIKIFIKQNRVEVPFYDEKLKLDVVFLVKLFLAGVL